MDSFVVDPEDARMNYALMFVDRLHALEDKMQKLTTQNASQVAKIEKLEAENAMMKAALAAQPTPSAYYLHINVPMGTTRQQVEDGLKAACTSQLLMAVTTTTTTRQGPLVILFTP